MRRADDVNLTNKFLFQLESFVLLHRVSDRRVRRAVDVNLTNGSFHIKSTHFGTKSDTTISNLVDNWHTYSY